MSYATDSARYLENDVMTRSPEWLVALTYEGLLTSLRRAAVQIEHGDLAGKAESLGKAGSLVAELLASLDQEQGGEIARALASLYAYFSLEIMNIGRSLDMTALARLTAMVEELHEAWVQAAEQVAPRRARSSLAVSAA